MTKKRGNGDGSICRRKSTGQWMAVVSYKGPDGKRHRASQNANSARHAKIVLEELRQKIFGPATAPLSQMTLGQYLDSWLTTEVEPNQEPATFDSYERAVRNYIRPHIGAVLVAELAPFHIQAWLAGLKSKGARSRQNAFVVLQSAMTHAAELQVVKTNPCDTIKRPKAEREEIRPFTALEAKAILNRIKGHRLAAVYFLALLHGPRQGEIFGLRWCDVDLAKSTIRIEQQVCEVAGRVYFRAPKTKAGKRFIHVDDRVTEALIERKARMMKEGFAGVELVFPNMDGNPMRRSNFGARHWSGLLKEIGLEHRGFHHTRHTAATLMLSDGVPVHEVSRILGHARPSITLDIYSHWISQPDSAGTTAVSRAIFG